MKNRKKEFIQIAMDVMACTLSQDYELIISSFLSEDEEKERRSARRCERFLRKNNIGWEEIKKHSERTLRKPLPTVPFTQRIFCKFDGKKYTSAKIDVDDLPF